MKHYRRAYEEDYHDPLPPTLTKADIALNTNWKYEQIFMMTISKFRINCKGDYQFTKTTLLLIIIKIKCEDLVNKVCQSEDHCDLC